MLRIVCINGYVGLERDIRHTSIRLKKMGRESTAYIALARKKMCITIISFPGNRHLGSHGFGYLYYLKAEN